MKESPKHTTEKKPCLRKGRNTQKIAASLSSSSRTDKSDKNEKFSGEKGEVVYATMYLGWNMRLQRV